MRNTNKPAKNPAKVVTTQTAGRRYPWLVDMAQAFDNVLGRRARAREAQALKV